MKPRRQPPVASRDHVQPDFRGRRWRLGNTVAFLFARAGIGPMALLTTLGRRTGRPYTVPVVPVEHDGAWWLVAPYGSVQWLHNVRAGGPVTLRYGRHVRTYQGRDATPAEAGPVLRRYATVATRTRSRFPRLDAPDEAFVAAAARCPVVELVPADGVVGPRADRPRRPRRP